MEHEAMLMHARGFGDTRLSWIKSIFRSEILAVLLNGVPGKTFYYKRGVRQGDPLSPMLFVLVADLLQYLINNALEQGLLQLLVPCALIFLSQLYNMQMILSS